MDSRRHATGIERIENAIVSARKRRGLAVGPFLTAGYPDPDRFADLFRRIALEADLVELGVPFSDPIADGPTIQRSSRAALQSGITITWILDLLRAVSPATPILLMSYANPILAYGIDRLARDCAHAGVCGFIVPDLPFEESDDLSRAAAQHGLCVVRMVSPVTSDDRLRRMCSAAGGFIYTTTIRGTTGARDAIDASVFSLLDRVRSCSRVPVLAGFGVRTPEDVARLQPYCDGVVVGSALIEAMDGGVDPVEYLRRLIRLPEDAGQRGVLQ